MRLKIDAEFRHLPLAELRLMIDEEFFILSDAWYERYVGSAETPESAVASLAGELPNSGLSCPAQPQGPGCNGHCNIRKPC